MNKGFLKQQAALFEGLFILTDLGLVLMCFLFTHRIIIGTFSPLLESLLVIQATLVGTYIVFRQSGTYRSARGRTLTSEIGRLFLAWMLVVLLIGLFAFLTKTGEVISRRWFGISMLSAFFALSALRYVVRFIMSQLRERGLNWRSVLVVGTSQIASHTIESLDKNKWTGMKIVGIVTKDIAELNMNVSGYSVVSTCENLHSYVEAQRELGRPIDQIWIALPLKDENTIGQIVDSLKDSSTNVCIIPDVLGAQLMQGAFDEVGGIPLISLTNVRITSVGEAVKRLFDFCIATFSVVFLSPVYLMIAILIKLESSGPVFFKQRRYGLDGREFMVWKFRSMSTTEDDDKVTQAVAGDSRVTRLGSFLRRTSLDELPQLFNVIAGSMSLVGPRPHAVVHNEEYRRKITGYMMRHKIKPGITGWAQVNGWRGETDTLEKMEKRVEFDLEYMKNWSPWFDIKILALTLVRGFVNKNAY